MNSALPNRYLNWRMIDGRKMPCDRFGNVVDAHDQRHHTDYATATAAPYGVAFALRAEDGLFFLDLDKCRLPDGTWKPEAEAIFLSFAGAWGEISQSGTGLHILGRCDPAKLKDRRNKWSGWLEFYTDARFIAFGSTGWHPICGTATGADFTDQLLKLVPQREHLGELPEGVDPTYTGPQDDDALVQMMLRSTGGAGAMFGMKATVAQLWNADAAVLARVYPAFNGNPADFDHSSADAALMSHLAFWTGKDMPRMDRLFRRSALVRPKYLDREDYRRDTIQNAARLCQKVYDHVAPQPTVTQAATAAGIYMTVAEMQDHFRGCVYVRDAHRVLVPDGAMLRVEQFNAAFGGYLFQTMPDGTKPTAKAFEALTENKAARFPQAIRPCFRPDLSPGTILSDGSVNTYVPPNVEMREGDVTPYLDLLEKLLPDANDRAILLTYLAAVVQYPGVKFQWAPVLQGAQGNGKTTLFSALLYALGGNRYTHQPKAKQLGGQFNSWLEGKVFILVEEVHMEGRREILDTLKPLITNHGIEVERKGVDQRMIQNLANWAFCTNYKDAVLKSENDRRYAIFYTAQQTAEDIARDGMSGDYFPRLRKWLADGGYAAVAHYLKHYAISAALNPAGACHRAPVTSSTAEAIEESRGPIEQAIMEAVENEEVGFKHGYVFLPAVEALLTSKRLPTLSPRKRADVVRSLGFTEEGRATMYVGNYGCKPTYLRRPGTRGEGREILEAQGFGFITRERPPTVVPFRRMPGT